MRFGLFGGARTKRSVRRRRQPRLPGLHRLRAGGRAARLPQHVHGGAPLHRPGPGLGLHDAAGLPGREDPAHPARHRGGGAALAQPGAGRGAGGDARPALRRALRLRRRQGLPQGRVRRLLHPASRKRGSASTRRWRSSARPGPREGRFSHHGKRWHYEDIVVEPAPLQRPHPPLWMAAGSDGSIRRAAREGYNLLLDQLASVDQVIERVPIFPRGVRSAGRAYDPTHGGRRPRPAALPRGGGAGRGARDAPARGRRDRRPGQGQAAGQRRGRRRAAARHCPTRWSPGWSGCRRAGCENILLVDPNATVGQPARLRAEVMPAFGRARPRGGRRMSAPRLPPHARGAWTRPQQAVWDRIASGARGGVGGPFLALLSSAGALRPRRAARRLHPLRVRRADAAARDRHPRASGSIGRRTTSGTPMRRSRRSRACPTR